ncbi:spore wall synthesis complex protein [Actinocorallia libanotica]|uniref:Spore wall synthesis complex protein n=1 Tax=Actinocorallia libanotica TaxID=46162 RepID=A0ABN1RBM8_9ACTN
MGGTVPLSEHEQRLLEQIERELYAEDPKFAHAVRTTNPQSHYKRQIVKAVLGLVVGIAVLMAGLVVSKGSLSVAISVTGFLLMLASGVWALTSWKRMTGIGGDFEPAAGRPAGRAPRGERQQSGFMNRLEERWRRRSEGES